MPATTLPITTVELRKSRKTKADEFFESFDFGEDIVTDHDHWNEDGKYWSKKVHGDTEGGERFMCSFGVEFSEKTDEILHHWVEPLA